MLLRRGESAEDTEVLKATFKDPAILILKEWKTLEKSAMDEALVEPLSSEEKLQVITAMKSEFYSKYSSF